MPRIVKFFLADFKGATDVEIDLAGRSTAPITTLIGLNESGKTTILEGISKFSSTDPLSDLFSGTHARVSISDAIPVSKKAAFTGSIKVGARFALDKEDIDGVSRIVEEDGLMVNKKMLDRELEIISHYEFEDSIFKRRNNVWDIWLWVKKSEDATFYKFERAGDDKQPDLWLRAIKHIQSRLPAIFYFPTFLVDMPPLIYLKPHAGETAINRNYREILQDVLDATGENITLEKHVVDRIDQFKSKKGSENWFSLLLADRTRTHIDAVFQKAAGVITQEVLGSWSKVFQRPSGAKAINLEWNVDASRDDLPYVSIFASDGASSYALSERSLGFRWFFSFLLFTSFKRKKAKPHIFLFDEPAANLHAKAQAHLLRAHPGRS